MWKIIAIISILFVGIGSGSYDVGLLGIGLIGMVISFIKACIDFSNSKSGKKISNNVTNKQKEYENYFGVIDWENKE